MISKMKIIVLSVRSYYPDGTEMDEEELVYSPIGEFIREVAYLDYDDITTEHDEYNNKFIIRWNVPTTIMRSASAMKAFINPTTTTMTSDIIQYNILAIGVSRTNHNCYYGDFTITWNHTDTESMTATFRCTESNEYLKLIDNKVLDNVVSIARGHLTHTISTWR